MSERAKISKEHNGLGTDTIFQLLIRYAIPSIVSMVVMSLYNIVDQLFIGWGVGYLGNAATTVAFPIVTVGLALALLIGNGSAAFISLELGRGNSDKANRTLGNALTLVMVSGIFISVLGLVFLQPILRAMGATEAFMPYAVEYTSVILMGMPFAMLSPAIASIIRADGSPRYSMISTLAGAVLNTILDPIFIFGFDMGVKGAAIATVISQIFSAVLILGYVLHHGKVLTFSPENLKLKWDIVKKQCAFGSSSFVTQMSIVVVNVVMNNSLTYYGAQSAYGSEIPLSAMGIVLKINAILISCILGVAIGAQPILGFNYGAGNYNRVKRTYKTEIAFALTLSSIVCLMFITVPQVFVRAFGDSSLAFNSFATHALRTAMCCVFIAGFQIPSAGYFQAVGKPLKAMILNMTRALFCQVTFVLILPLFFGLDGILYALPATDVISSLLTMIFIAKELRHLDAAGCTAANA